MNRSFVAVLGFFLVLPAMVQAQERELFAEDFEKRRSDFFEKIASHERVEVVKEAGPDGSAGVKVTYKPTDRGSDRVAFYLPLSKGVEEASLSYDVKFDEAFQFVRGGKLPGLCPENPVSGGDSVSEESWSARLMWSGDDGSLISYLYHQDQPKSTGDSRRAKGFKFERGRYHAVTIYLKLNSDEDETDGFIEVHVDGRKVVEHRGVRFRGDDGRDSLITKLMFSTFHGGADRSWAPSEPVFAYFDNFEVRSGKAIREAAKP